MEHVSQFSAMATNDRVDGGSGVIYGVSVITKGEAQGRNAGTWIDETTLSQIASTAQKYRGGCTSVTRRSRASPTKPA